MFTQGGIGSYALYHLYRIPLLLVRHWPRKPHRALTSHSKFSGIVVDVVVVAVVVMVVAVVVAALSWLPCLS